MTSVDYLKKAFEEGNDVYFTYKGKPSGIEPSVNNSIFTYEMWFGKKWKKFDSFEELIHDKFFDGKSVADLIKEEIVDFRFV